MESYPLDHCGISNLGNFILFLQTHVLPNTHYSVSYPITVTPVETVLTLITQGEAHSVLHPQRTPTVSCLGTSSIQTLPDYQ